MAGQSSLLYGLFDSLHPRSPLLGRFWVLLLMLLRIVLLGTVASNLFADDSMELTCNAARLVVSFLFPISMYRLWISQAALTATPTFFFLVYATHHKNKANAREDLHLHRLYVVNVACRLLTELVLLFIRCWFYGFKVEGVLRCTAIPCPHAVNCFLFKSSEKTFLLRFFFAVGLLLVASNIAELVQLVRRRQEPAQSGSGGSLLTGANEFYLLNVTPQAIRNRETAALPAVPPCHFDWMQEKLSSQKPLDEPQ
ncbi:hypothetical protein Z043_122263 [Scleropages formosus]|uniref:Connexin cysteine-rich domain-containing protein n=1 Tax=Scleropages formosus TaxID=113540 RepID=A0A0N8JW29_SCLFO|nr:hypothetical protein Z043_122263 [Scleropages formosus]